MHLTELYQGMWPCKAVIEVCCPPEKLYNKSTGPNILDVAVS
jgi:hypothetical protein